MVTGPKISLPPCVMVRVAVRGPSKTGLTPVQLPLGQPAVFPLTVEDAVMGPTVRFRLPRPLWSALPRSWLPVVVAGTGFWPGAWLPPLFWHVYRTVPLRTIVAIAGWLPKPLPSPVAVNVSSAVFRMPSEPGFWVKVGPECHVTAARATAAARLATTSGMVITKRRIGVFSLIVECQATCDRHLATIHPRGR